MGILISRFQRKKKSSEEKLEDLTQKIKEINEFQECEEEKLRSYVKQLLMVSAVIYVLTLIIFFTLSPDNGKKFYYLTFILFPVLIFLFRRLMILYFKRKITKNKLKIEVYKKEKQQILDDVKETETYKVAKRILEKYDVPQASKLFTPPKVSTPIPIPKPTSGTVSPYQSSAANTEIRRRYQSNQLVTAQRAPNLVRPIVTENKGVFDRIIQKVVGDGPNYRYALICKACGNHNGMALQEEFEFLSYRCAFCSFFNPAHKQRIAMQNAFLQSLNLKSLKNTSDSDSGDDRRPLEITELEDSESDYKAAKYSPETSKENNCAVIEEIKPSHNQDSKSDSSLESTSVSDNKPETFFKETISENENTISEDSTKTSPTNGDNAEDDGFEKIESEIPPEVSPMEVDEDENPESDVNSNIKNISLES